VVILSDPHSGVDICAWSGTADAVIVDFERWLTRVTAAAS
jgi:hypothetical protein